MLIGMAALWILFAPTQFGGQASYVMIAGASMEPELRWGDLVIARKAADYHVGDVVTYQHPIVGPVIHRVIEKSSHGYTLRGDNNDWIDSYQPVNDEIIGQAWIKLPSAARVLYELRTPQGLFLLSIAIGFMVLATALPNKTTDNPIGSNMKLKKTGVNIQALSALVDGWLFPILTILLASTLLGFFAFSKPLMQMVQVDIPYEHEGKFSYQATGSESIYDYGKIETGDPIFHSLETVFNVNFDYSFTSDAEATSNGKYRLVLVVSEPNGWSRELELVPFTPYSNNGFSTSATINLADVQSLIETLELRTGYKQSPFDVRVVPIVISNATVAGHPFVERFSPSLDFKLDDYQLYLNGTNPFETDSDPLEPVEAGMQPDFYLVPNTLNILGLSFTVETARWVAGIVGSISLVGLGFILRPMIQSWRKNESNKIALQYPSLLLEVEKLPKIKTAGIIQISSFPDLAKIAESMDALVLHHAAQGKHTYILQTDEHTYRFTVEDELEEEQA
jgi:signal peptidase I